MPKPPLLLIRTDASVRIGTGHAVRCLTLAKALAQAGWECRFACRPYDGHAMDILTQEGFTCHPLALHGPEPDKDRLDPDQAADAAAFIGLWRSGNLPKPDAVLVDHYSLDRQWEAAVRAEVPKLIVQDDLANRPHDCAVLIDSTPLPEHHYRDLTPADCRRLLGLDYAILRTEFPAARDQLRRNWSRVQNLLIFFGGNDPDNLTGRMLPLLADSALQSLSVDVVIGRANPNREAIEAHCANLPQVTLHIQTPRMAELMAGAHLALGAGGTASWERLCLGLPTIIFELADNQRAICRWLLEHELAFWGGTAADAAPEAVLPLLCELITQPDRLQALSLDALQRVDGQGLTRLAAEIVA